MTTYSIALTEQERETLEMACSACLVGITERQKHSPHFQRLAMITDRLHRLSEPETPLWRTDLFTDAERDTMLILVQEEISDSIKSVAAEQLDNEPLAELLGYACGDVEGGVYTLKHIPEVSGEFLRSQEEDGDNFPMWLDWAKRFKLITDDETDLTDLGREFIHRYG